MICMACMLTGTYLSFFLDSAPAPTIVLILTGVFIVAFLRRQVLNRRASRLICWPTARARRGRARRHRRRCAHDTKDLPPAPVAGREPKGGAPWAR